MEKELQVLNPSELMRQASDAAGICKEIVSKTAISIQGRNYVPISGWQAIALTHGCVLSSGSVEYVEGGFRSIGQVRRMSDGTVLSEAEGFLGDDEKAWSGRDTYAKRAMAQTRAMSRAARSAFAHVVVMMDAGLSTTPAEEVPSEDFQTETPVNGHVSPSGNGNRSHSSLPSASKSQPPDLRSFEEGEVLDKAGRDYWFGIDAALKSTSVPNGCWVKKVNNDYVVVRK